MYGPPIPASLILLLLVPRKNIMESCLMRIAHLNFCLHCRGSESELRTHLKSFFQISIFFTQFANSRKAKQGEFAFEFQNFNSQRFVISRNNEYVTIFMLHKNHKVSSEHFDDLLRLCPVNFSPNKAPLRYPHLSQNLSR